MKPIVKALVIIAMIGLFFFAVFVILMIAIPVDDTKEKVTSSAQTVNQEVIDAAKEREKDSILAARAKKKRELDSIATAKKEAAKTALKSFRAKTDEFDNESFYRDKRAPQYANVNFIFPYLGQKDDRYWMRLKFQYESDDWLFIDQVRIKTDSSQYSYTGEFERDNHSRIWEWLDISVGAKELAMLKDMAQSKEVTIRYIGSQYKHDRKLTSKEKAIMQKTIDIYVGLQ